MATTTAPKTGKDTIISFRTASSNDDSVDLTLEDLYWGTCVHGMPNSGKTSGAVVPLLKALMTHPSRPGGLVLDLSGTLAGYVRQFAAEHDRVEDVVVVSPEAGVRWNPLGDGELPAEVLAAWMLDCVDTISHGDNPREEFWLQHAETAIRNIVRIKRTETADPADKTSRGTATLTDIFALATGDEKLQMCMNKVDMLVDEGSITEAEIAGIRIWYNMWRNLDSRVKTSISAEIARFTSMFTELPRLTAAFCPENKDATLRSLASCRTEGKIVVLDMGLPEYGEVARTVGVLLKRAFFQANMGASSAARKDDGMRPLFFVCEDYPAFQSGMRETERIAASRARRAKCACVVSCGSVTDKQADVLAQFDLHIGTRQLTYTESGNAIFHLSTASGGLRKAVYRMPQFHAIVNSLFRDPEFEPRLVKLPRP